MAGGQSEEENSPFMQHHLVNQIQRLHESTPEIFDLTTNMNMINFQHNSHHLPSSSNHLMGVPTSVNHEDHHPGSWQENNKLFMDDSSLRCVFTCEGNERPSQGLSLSLSSNNPSGIGLQSFELRHHSLQDNYDNLRYMSSSNSREGFYGKSVNMIQHHDCDQEQGQFQLRNSKFLGPAQELLNEFCSLETNQTDPPFSNKIHPSSKTNQWEDEHGSSSLNSSSKRQNLVNSIEIMELQKRKANLFSMLEEVDRRYKHYCDQMKAVVSSFEAVAGNGAAKVYSSLALKAMSRHFRCLRDGIVGQIEETKKAMGEKDIVAPGTTRGETPRLRLLDQTLRQQRTLQQMNMMEAHPWRPQRGLPERSVSVLRAWLFEHFLHPYPSDVDKHILARQTGLSRSQVSNWFINARVRLWKPMVEEMYLEETKDHDLDQINNMNLSDQPSNQNPNTRSQDKKPTHDQLVRMDSEYLSSVISPTSKNGEKDDNTLHTHQNLISFGRVNDTYNSMEMDFSSYNHHSANAAAYDASESTHHNFGGGVSLTLGLQQHGGSTLGMDFSSGSQGSLFYSRDNHVIDECETGQYSDILEGDHGHNLPYRNLLGAQLLHDLAG